MSLAGRSVRKPKRVAAGPLARGASALLAAAATVLLTAALAASGETDATIVLVRHAEKEPGDDPELSPEGRARAEALVRLLSDAGIERVYSTDTRRTRATAAPLAERQGIEVTLYDPRDLAGFAEELRRRGGRALVVGHSNTTPELVGLLGGEAGEPIAEDEYERVYVLVVAPGAVQTLRLRLQVE